MKKGSRKKVAYNLSEELGKAINLHQNGQFQQAEVIYKKVVRHAPKHPDALHMLGILSTQTGKLENAVDLMRKSIKYAPGRPDYLFNLARAYHDFEKLDDAIAIYQEYLLLVPDDPEVLHWLGRICHDKKEYEQAIIYYQRALEKSPGRVDSLNGLGLTHHAQGDYEQAVACYEQALKYQPNDYIVLNNLGCTFRILQKFDKATACFRKTLSIEPSYAEAHYNLGFVLSLQQMYADSFDSLQLALSIKPEYPEAYALLGKNYLVQGDFNNALASCKKSLSINPYDEMAVFLMASIQNCAEDKDTVTKIEHLFLQKDIKDEQKRYSAFALGKAYADTGDYDKSFFYLSEGNRLERRSYEYSIEEDERLFDLIKEVYNELYILKHSNEDNKDNTPIFILGMPRSGTSLVEQILASHPDVYGAGELEDLQRIILNLTGHNSPFEAFEKISRNGGDFYELLAEEYLVGSRKHSSSAKFITDKMPHNFLYIGAIRLAFPNAKIIHCVRGPMDNCFSIYKHLFEGGWHKYANDLQELGQYYLIYLDLMKYWNNVFPGSIYDLKYEDMIADQEGETRKLLQHCGLSWNDQCLSFYKTSRNVSTLSLVQVRKPIYKDSVQLWEKYRKHLEPLRSILLDGL